MKAQINAISEVRFGLYAQPAQSGGAAYLQVRQFDEHGRLICKPEDFINIDDKSKAHLLKDGDVLFVGKGSRLFAWCYRQSQGQCVASSIFFVLRPDQNKVYPEYLAAMLNAPQSKASFQQIGSGTNILSIRKSELGAFEIPLLPIEYQKNYTDLYNLHMKEVSLLESLIKKKQELFQGIQHKIIFTP